MDAAFEQGWGLEDAQKAEAENSADQLGLHDGVASDAELREFFSADARDNLKTIITGQLQKIPGGYSAFPKDSVISRNSQRVAPEPGYFDIGLHGMPTAVCYGTESVNMSPRLLAAVIRHLDGWNGQPIRLLSCSTGKIENGQYCFAEELANALGVNVMAPTHALYIRNDGSLKVGKQNEGTMKIYKPNERRRRK